MIICSDTPWDPELAKLAAMAWLQSIADAYSSALIVPSGLFDSDAADNVERELYTFIKYTLPRLHLSFGTDPNRKATYHLSQLEVCDDSAAS
jgi:hypothetical protein